MYRNIEIFSTRGAHFGVYIEYEDVTVPTKHLPQQFLLFILPSDSPSGQDSNLLPPVSRAGGGFPKKKASLSQVSRTFILRHSFTNNGDVPLGNISLRWRLPSWIYGKTGHRRGPSGSGLLSKEKELSVTWREGGKKKEKPKKRTSIVQWWKRICAVTMLFSVGFVLWSLSLYNIYQNVYNKSTANWAKIGFLMADILHPEKVKYYPTKQTRQPFYEIEQSSFL